MINSLQIRMDWKAEGFGFANSCWKYRDAQRCAHQSVQHSGFAGREAHSWWAPSKSLGGCYSEALPIRVLHLIFWPLWWGAVLQIKRWPRVYWPEPSVAGHGRSLCSSFWAACPTIFTLGRSYLSGVNICVYFTFVAPAIILPPQYTLHFR